MLLTVIMPIYNQEELFRIGLDSIPKRDDIEIIVIDDCSTDNSLENVRKYKEETGKNITILHNERNRGIGYSVNRGLDLAKGEYIVQLDSDGDYFVNLENGLKQLDGTDLIYYSLQANSGKFWVITEGNPQHYSGTVKFMRREFVGDLREPHLENCEDVYFYEELRKKNPTEKYLTTDIMYLHYNYPREGSLTWNVLHGITPRAMKRD